MLDTIKVGIPISESQHQKLLYSCANDKPQWVLYHPQSGEIQFLRQRGLLEKDNESFHRDIRWDIPEIYRKGETYLAVELSLPKFWYGHNIRLLYKWIDALIELKKQLQKGLKCRFPVVYEWKVFRVDFCYAWKCSSQETAQNILDSLKRLQFPRKVPTVYRETIQFKGKTYSFKVYLKHPEFLEHDGKTLNKTKANPEWIRHLEVMSTGVLRIEATCRYKYLVRKNIKQVGDLLKPQCNLILSCEEEQNIKLDFNNVCAIISDSQKNTLDDEKAFTKFLLSKELGQADIKISALNAVTDDWKSLDFPEGTITYERKDKTLTILNEFLKKFIGENVGMDDVAQVKEKLSAMYEGLKLTTLLGFWLYIQKCGVDAARELYPKPTYYRMKSDLKKAGISLIEKTVVINDVNQEFVDTFKLKIPSLHAVNTVDDYKDSGNLLNNSNAEVEPRESVKKPVNDKLKAKIDKLKKDKEDDKR